MKERAGRKKGALCHAILFVAVFSSLNFLLIPLGRGESKSNIVRFAVMGDGPYLDKYFPIIKSDLAETSSKVDFVVHVGDIFRGECTSGKLSRSARLFRFSKAPFFITIGDNEYNGCVCPDEALRNWGDVFSRFHESWKNFDNASHQQGRPENTFFVSQKVLFVFLTLVGDPEFSRLESDRRMRANLRWLQLGIERYQDTVEAIVVFAHAGILRSTNKRYSKQFAKVFEGVRKPAYYFHGSIEGKLVDRQLLLLKQNYLEVPNLTRVGVEQAGEVPSLIVTISTGESVTMDLNRRLLQYQDQISGVQQSRDDASRRRLSLVRQYEYWVWVVKSGISVFLKCNMPWLYRFLTRKQSACRALICDGVLPIL